MYLKKFSRFVRLKNFSINFRVAFQTVNRAEIGDVVILDADNNTVESPFDDLNNLPQDVVGFIIFSVLPK